MGPYDWVAVVLTAFMVAFSVVAELEDLFLCTIAIARAGEKLSARWRFALTLLCGLRRWVFLPSLVYLVPSLVMILGGDVLRVCFNTVAILFLCEIDNGAYKLGLSKRVRRRMEAAARVELDEDAEATLVRAKAV